MTATPRALELARVAALGAAEKLASDIVAFDVSDRLAITDVFLVCSAPSDRQVRSIIDEVEVALQRDAGAKPLRREGGAEGRWVLLDYADIVVHVQHSEERSFYALERLWKDCPAIDLGLDERAQRGGDPLDDVAPRVRNGLAPLPPVGTEFVSDALAADDLPEPGVLPGGSADDPAAVDTEADGAVGADELDELDDASDEELDALLAAEGDATDDDATGDATTGDGVDQPDDEPDSEPRDATGAAADAVPPADADALEDADGPAPAGR